MLVGVLPRLLMVTGVASDQRLEHVFPAAANPFWPWGAAAHCMLGCRAAGGPCAAIAALAGWTAAAYLFGRWQFTRSLRFDFQEAQATVASAKDRPFAERLYRLPSLVLPDPLCAIVEKELRSLARTPRFRLVFVMGFSFGLVVWLPMMLRGRRAHSAVSGNFLAVVSLYALFLLAQVTYGNAFGFDRSAAQLYFCGARGHLARAGRQEHCGRHLHLPGDRGGGGGLCDPAAGDLGEANRRSFPGHRHRRAVPAGASAI